MAVHRTYEGYPPDTLHWAPGDAEPVDHTTLYDHADRPWHRNQHGWMRQGDGLLPGLAKLFPALALPWSDFVQKFGPVSSAPRRGGAL